ncbi:cytochrome P450 714C3 isoform X1 [Triticum aestivum]|uniref:Secologanin synthase n=3 Tax=Aegilops tauschii subsp. strangulata TaxID=200361 RepID=A0A453HJG4_AEGTS|nr:cytochrome P450 714C3-like isoform X1 [Triticum aestivum]
MGKLHLLALLLPVLLGLSLLYICEILWLRPERIRKKLRKQGVRGPRPTLLYGNTQEIKRIRQEALPAQKQDTSNYMSTLFPHFMIWRETYGSVFLYSTGAVEILYVSDPGMVKDMSHCTSSELGKPIFIQKSRKPLFGEGILVANGDIWAYQRKIIAQEFFMEKIKVMIELIVGASAPLLEAWDSMLDGTGGSREIDVDGYLRSFSADVIARACFGSDFATGEEIFYKLRQLQKAISQQDALVGLSAVWKSLPTKANREIQKLEQEVRLLILNVAKEHSRGSSSEDDDCIKTKHNGLLRSIVNSARHCPASYSGSAEDYIVDNCKNIYFAGHETTAVTVTWCLMLLATHPAWQDRARAEALEVCRGGTELDVDVLRRLKTVRKHPDMHQSVSRSWHNHYIVSPDHHGGPGDSPAVPSGVIDYARSAEGLQARWARHPTGDSHTDSHRDAAPRQGCLGPGRRRVPPGSVCERRSRGVRAVTHVPAVRARAQSLCRAEPGDDGAEGGARAPADQVGLLTVARVPARAVVPAHH